MRSNSPASPERRGGGKGGGMVHSAFSRKGIKDVCAAKLPRLPLRGGKGGAVSRPHQREAAAMAGGVPGIQPHYDLLFLTPTNRGVPGGCA